jgi:hypothetical protein
MRSCTAEHAKARRLVLQYRTGGLNTAKFRYRMKKATSPNCELCGQLDGGHHSFSGCPHLTGLYRNRHNDGGRLILRYIMKGAKGAAIAVHDVEKHQQHLPGHSGDRKLHARIPEWVYNRGGARTRNTSCTKATWQRYTPNTMLVTGDANTAVQNRHVHTVEIKYCKDTDRTAQLTEPMNNMCSCTST